MDERAWFAIFAVHHRLGEGSLRERSYVTLRHDMSALGLYVLQGQMKQGDIQFVSGKESFKQAGTALRQGHSKIGETPFQRGDDFGQHVGADVRRRTNLDVPRVIGVLFAHLSLKFAFSAAHRA